MINSTSINSKLNFYRWAVNLGINMVNFEPQNICFDAPKLNFSFHKNPQETKKKYNHVFKSKTN